MAVALPRNPDTFSPDQALDQVPAQVPAPVPARTPLSAVAPREFRRRDARYLAHDARNWLTVLQIYCDLLRTSGAVVSGHEKWIEEMSSAVERGQELVASLVESVERADRASRQKPGQASGQAATFNNEHHPIGSAQTWPLSRCSGNDSDPAPAVPVLPSLNLGDAIARRLPLLERLAGSEIQVEVDAAADSGHVAMAESAFERILQNLVGNAIEAMPQGGRLRIALRRKSGSLKSGPLKSVKPEPTTSALRNSAGKSRRSAPKTLLLRVYDTGSGIASERLPHIFEAGVSGKANRAGDSRRRGFGLAIVRELTERAGGTVRVRSRPGRGSCFEIELPSIEAQR